MIKTTITSDTDHLAEWYSSSVRNDREEVAELIGRLVQQESYHGYQLLGADHLGEYAYFNSKNRALAIIQMANFILNYPFELHSGCPKELTFELIETERREYVYFCSYPQKECGWYTL